jgi:hypothetical protein
MDEFKVALAGIAAAGAALVITPEPAKADHFGYAHQWIAQRFQRVSRPHVQQRPIVQRSVARVRPRARHVAVQRTADRRPIVRRVAYRDPASYRPPAVRQVVYRPYQVIYYRPIVRRVDVVHRPIFVQRRCLLPELGLCG